MRASFPSCSPALSHLVAGCAAECVAGMVFVPLDVVKQLHQHSLVPFTYSGKAASAASIHSTSAQPQSRLFQRCLQTCQSEIAPLTYLWQKEGFRGLYRGYLSTIAVFAPNSAIYFAVYEKLKALGLSSDPHAPPNGPKLLLYAIGAASVSAMCTNPLDVVKTRVQVTGTSAVQVLQNMAKNEGLLRSLRKGVWQRVFAVAPGMAITIACADYLRT